MPTSGMFKFARTMADIPAACLSQRGTENQPIRQLSYQSRKNDLKRKSTNDLSQPAKIKCIVRYAGSYSELILFLPRCKLQRNSKKELDLEKQEEYGVLAHDRITESQWSDY